MTPSIYAQAMFILDFRRRYPAIVEESEKLRKALRSFPILIGDYKIPKKWEDLR